MGAHGSTPVLLYDGDCGLCARSVQFVLTHEAPAPVRTDDVASPVTLRFAPLQGHFASEVRRAHPLLASVDSVVWFVPDQGVGSRLLVYSDAALAILSHLGGRWRLLAAVARWVPRGIRDGMYRLVARRRHQLFAPACLLPTQAQRVRFID